EITEPITTVRMLNRNTDKIIHVTVPIDPRRFQSNGSRTCGGHRAEGDRASR
ncbi:MAG: hypothetical protein LUE63_00660, partial [Lachnospiraceae bacterium]|nr:hypothetical protein [Lachnospiraceae bacterium]